MTMKRPLRFTLLALGLAAPAAPAAAQDKAPDKIQRFERRIEIRRTRGPGGAQDQTFSWVGDALDGKPIKGAPFSATAVTEIDQPLADGNRIRQKTSAGLARDSAGRSRRELALGAVGPLMASGERQLLVHLHDPATGDSITLDPARKMAFKMPRGLFTAPVPPPRPEERGVGARVEEDVLIGGLAAGGATPAPGEMAWGPPPLLPLVDGLPPDAAKPLREDLGTQLIEGVRAEGVRTTVTVPAGKMGNERPLAIVSERWFSPELGMVVQSRHSDPRLGTTTYRLTGIDRREPPAALFEVPAGYKNNEGPVLIRRHVTSDGKAD
jgi:hypothetical protein